VGDGRRKRKPTADKTTRKSISEGAFLAPKKSVDFLQGIEMLLAWYHYNLNSVQTTALLFLARSVCVSLGLYDFHSVAGPKSSGQGSLEHMRAVAGTYYLNAL
jgi:hypothetical protein